MIPCKKYSDELNNKLFEMYSKSLSNLAYTSPFGMMWIADYNKTTSDEYFIQIGDNAFIYDESNNSITGSYVVKVDSCNLDLASKLLEQHNIKEITYVSPNDLSFDFFKKIGYTFKEEPMCSYEPIYPIERFTEFKEVDNKKRLANQFFKNNLNAYIIQYEKKYDNDLINLIETWNNLSEHPVDLSNEIYGISLIKEIKNPLFAYILIVNEKIEGYGITEINNNKTATIFQIKCNSKIKGIYQAFQHLICKKLVNVDWINYTNLTDIEGLKNAKLQMKPIRFEKPYCTI